MSSLLERVLVRLLQVRVVTLAHPPPGLEVIIWVRPCGKRKAEHAVSLRPMVGRVDLDHLYRLTSIPAARVDVRASHDLRALQSILRRKKILVLLLSCDERATISVFPRFGSSMSIGSGAHPRDPAVERVRA
jgi:hypothetical protein